MLIDKNGEVWNLTETEIIDVCREVFRDKPRLVELQKLGKTSFGALVSSVILKLVKRHPHMTKFPIYLIEEHLRYLLTITERPYPEE